jgi:hypothetical protein
VSLKAINWAVMVVPMLAPKMTGKAAVKEMIPALRNPMSMTEVALELWMSGSDEDAHKSGFHPVGSHLFQKILEKAQGKRSQGVAKNMDPEEKKSQPSKNPDDDIIRHDAKTSRLCHSSRKVAE